MAKYYLQTKNFGDETFEADSDKDAEHYVEEKYNADDGEMTRLAGYLAARAPVSGGVRLVVDRDPASLL